MEKILQKLKSGAYSLEEICGGIDNWTKDYEADPQKLKDKIQKIEFYLESFTAAFNELKAMQ